MLWIGLQNATWTPSFLHHPIWGMAADALDRPVAGSISVNRDLTTLALIRLVTAASVFWIAVQLCRDASRAICLLYCIAIIGVIYAGYGLISRALTPGYVLWIKTSAQHGYGSSTFINRNSFAAYAGMGLVVIGGLILRFYRHEFKSVGGSVRFRIATFIEVTGQKAAALLGCGFVILVGLLLTQSRGGTLATGLGLFVLGALTLKARTKGSVEQRGAIIIFGALLLGVTVLVFGDLLVGRIAVQGFSDEGRLAVYTIAMRSIFDAPLLGYGMGPLLMFSRCSGINPRARLTDGMWLTAPIWKYFKAGLIYGSMLVASVVLLVLACVKGAMTRRENETIPCVAASAAFLVGIHSLLDFSLQIQAIAITFMALLGAGVAQSQSSRLKLED